MHSICLPRSPDIAPAILCLRQLLCQFSATFDEKSRERAVRYVLRAVRSLLSEEKKLSNTALSQTLPARLIEQTMPWSAIKRWFARTYVEERLAGVIVAASGGPARGPAVSWKGRRHGARKDRRWPNAWSPEQIARRLPVDFPDDETMRISHEAIYQALFVQGRGALRRELTACLRTGRALRMPRARTRGRGKSFISPEIMISQRPAEAADRAVPGHREGDLILGLGSSASSTMLHLPRRMGRGHEARVKNGPPLAGHGAEAVRDAHYAHDRHLA